MSEPAPLSVEGLAVRIGAAQVLDGVSLELRPGERVALAGESGCGKTTTARATLGLLPGSARVTAGRVRVAGHDLAALEEVGRRRLRGGSLALIPQHAGAALNPVIPVGRQVETVLGRVLGIQQRAARRRTESLFGEVGLDTSIATGAVRAHELSGGQCQRVMIAMALGCEPRVLIADEPTSALDVTTQARVMACLVAMTQQRGTALLLITHDLALAGAHCGRGLVMYGGRIVESAAMGELLQAPAHPYTAGLLAAVPRLRGPRRPVEAIPGSAPSPDALPPGCHFEPRCPRATRQCRERRPEFGDDGGRNRAACFHPLNGADHE